MSNVANIVQNGIAPPCYLVDQFGNPLISTASGDAQSTGVLGAAPYLYNGNSADRQRSAYGDALATTGIEAAGLMIWNGGSFDRLRGNIDFTVFNVTAGTTTQTSSDFTNYNGLGVKVVLDVTSAGTGSVTLAIQGKDIASGKYYTILTGAAVTTNSTNVYTVHPGITATSNVSAADVLPRTWHIVVTANNTNSCTYTVGASTLSL